MTERDLSYRLTADSREFERGFNSAERSARAFEAALRRAEAEQARIEAAMTRTGLGLAGAGALIAGGLVVATKAAIDWESAWTGVAKVIDGSPEQLADLEEGLRGLTHVLPQTHEEIAGVAAAAGQLGVAREDILDFTKTMVNMGTATDLASEDAAFALSRMMNIMQTAPADVGRLGASIVELGNNAAAMESEIVEMALRIAGAGHAVRMSEADVIGFAGALSSVGIAAEAGGSAISRSFIIIEGAVRAGGANLEAFAKISGVTADEFKQAWQKDAARATASFVEGLGRIQKSGGDVFKTLNDLGMSEVLLRDAMLRLAGAGDLVSRSLDVANQGWDENTALLDEAAARYQTVESRMQIAQNKINDFAIDIGNVLLPAVGKAADLIGDFAAIFGDLPGPLKTVLAVLGVVAAALLLTAGAALLAVPKIAAYRAGVEMLINSQGRLATATLATTSALGRVGTFLAGPWGIAIGVAIAALATFAVRQAEARGRARELVDTLDAQSGAVTRDTRLWIANKLVTDGVISAAKDLGIGAADMTRAVLGEADAVELVNQKLDEYYKKRGFFEGSEEGPKKVEYALLELSGATALAQEMHKELAGATDGTKRSTDDLEPSVRQLAVSTGLTADAANDLAGEVAELDKSMRAMYDSVFGLETAEDAAVKAMKRMTDEAKKNKGALTGNSEAALTNRDNVRGLIRAHMEQISALAETGATTEELTAKSKALKKEFIEQATKAGMTRDAIKEYAKTYDKIPPTIATTIKTPGLDAAYQASKAYRDLLLSIPEDRVTRLHVLRAGQVNPASGMAHGGEVDGPFGYDVVPRMLTRGEFVSTVGATQQNRAALMAANSGAKLAVVGAPGTAGGGGGGGTHNEWNIYPQRADFGPRDFDLLMAQHEARERYGRPE